MTAPKGKIPTVHETGNSLLPQSELDKIGAARHKYYNELNAEVEKDETRYAALGKGANNKAEAEAVQEDVAEILSLRQEEKVLIDKIEKEPDREIRHKYKAELYDIEMKIYIIFRRYDRDGRWSGEKNLRLNAALNHATMSPDIKTIIEKQKLQLQAQKGLEDATKKKDTQRISEYSQTLRTLESEIQKIFRKWRYNDNFIRKLDAEKRAAKAREVPEVGKSGCGGWGCFGGRRTMRRRKRRTQRTQRTQRRH